MKKVFVLFLSVLSLNNVLWAQDSKASEALRCQSQNAEMLIDMLLWNPGDGAYVFMNLQSPTTGEKRQFSGVDLGYLDCSSKMIEGNSGLPSIGIECRTSAVKNANIDLFYNVSVGSPTAPQNVSMIFFLNGDIPLETAMPISLTCKKVDADKAFKDFKKDGQ